MFRTLEIFVIAALLVPACRRPDESERAQQAAARALTGVLVYPGSSVVSVSAGDEAAGLVLTVTATMAAVAAWYKHALETNGWVVKSERVESGHVTIYAEQRQPSRPLWITIRPNAGGPGTTYTLLGALPTDSTVRADSVVGGRR